MDRIETMKTINVLSLASLIAYFIFDIKWLLWIAAGFMVGNILESRITALIAKYWMGFASFMGNVNSKLILTLVFYLILTPLALIYRVFNKELVRHFRDNRKKSYFEDVNSHCRKKDFEKLW